MNAYLFPGQGAQFSGMGKDLYDENDKARALFEEADDILGFALSKVMFEGSADELKETKVTQPAVFLHSVAAATAQADFKPDMAAGHSLGEFSALVATGCIPFADGLKLVSIRANAMQKACEENPSTMAAVLGAEDALVEEACAAVTNEVVVAANYNSPGQLVISGSLAGIDAAIEILKEKGVRKAIKLPVGGAFHSPLMESARDALAEAIDKTPFQAPLCPVYQNVNAQPQTDPDQIKANLVSQLSSAVRWTDTIRNMVRDGATDFTELGPGTVLSGLVRKIRG